MPSQSSGIYRNLWALTVLCLLRERPMHPYEMQRLIRQRHNDNFLDLKRGSLYHAIERLERVGFIHAMETSREGRRPERTVYQLTEKGEREVLDWLRELLAKPVRESSQFLAALSYLAHLPPEDALDQLQIRVRDLECGIVGLNAVLQNLVPQIGRVLLIEVEYAGAMRKAELEWVRSLIEEIRSGRLTWGAEGRGMDGLCRPAETPAREGECRLDTAMPDSENNPTDGTGA
jgi:DNA-binding PadR family transcriptional regulator